MNRALFRAMMKQNRKKVAKLAAGIVLYETLLTWVYPVIAENSAVTQLTDSIPSAVKTVFGVAEEARVDTFEAFISAQFLARIWAMLMSLYNVETANELLAKLADDGSLALLLSTPVPRGDYLFTQALVLFSGNALLVLATLLGLCCGAYRFGITIDSWRYCRFGLLSLAFYSLIGAYSLFFSALTAQEDLALTLAAGATLTFYALDVAGGLSEQHSWIRRLSLFQCYQPQEVLEGTSDPARKIIGLTAGSVILLQLGIYAFNEKDLAI
ncbi:ABC transporter permease subunit [Desulfitobacterium chlororespirans]|uniref:ABC-2 type transport system permease protein n=1 Tax=Desulfitobacterium chlororespirans DSM 11544 TaxID=1121395 RepID=A0A1M7TWD6_9FIRM|nr:ABC transporter permease subunit [Desulfitobacterium chlororespirans]SHN74943.1 ABC-2 type transport system permease protein [Desulfitobacterium chlororespirans DSM 11544]